MKALRLTTAIASIVTGSLIAVYCLQWADYYDGYQTINFGLAIAVIVLGSLLCRDKKNKGIAIALLSVSSVLLYFLLASVTTTFYDHMGMPTARTLFSFENLITLSVIGIVFLSSFYLGNMKKYWSKDGTPLAQSVPVSPPQCKNAQSAGEMSPAQVFANNIVILKRMRESETLTEKEYKMVLSREIERFSGQE